MNGNYLLAELEDKIINTVLEYMEKVPRPFGVLLSGGFDSGFLAAIIKPDFAYRLRFPYGIKFDESRYSDAIARHLGLTLKEITVSPENFKENFAAAVTVMGSPSRHFSVVPLYLLVKALKEDKIKNVVSGEGIDEYLGGYARQIIFDHLNTLYEVPELRNYHETIDKVIGDPLAKYAELMGYDYDKVAQYKALPYQLQGKIGKMDMDQSGIEDMEQKMAHHFGVNFHYPYINPELAEYCYRLPDHYKIRNGVTKWAFRQIAMKYLPEMMRDRAKMGGPVAPVNRFMGWFDREGDFGKTTYLEEQKRILNLNG